MKKSDKYVKVTTYTSEVRPDVSSTRDNDGAIIEWADAHPLVWSICGENKSKMWGRESSHYMGFQRGESPAALIDRIRTFRSEFERNDTDFFSWSARNTYAIYADKKNFKSGFFQQFDGTYDRGCAYIDYIPGTLEAVIDRFVLWCGRSYETRAVFLDKKIVRDYSEHAGAGVPRL